MSALALKLVVILPVLLIFVGVIVAVNLSRKREARDRQDKS